MNVELEKLLNLGGFASLLSEVLCIHGPLAMQEYALGHWRVPDPSHEGPAVPGTAAPAENHPNALRLYPELGLAVQPVNGIVFPGIDPVREAYYGYFNTDRIHRSCEIVARSEEINTLALVLDTPGGAARGLHPASESLLALPSRRAGLETVSYVPRLCASAGMYLAGSTGGIHAAPSAVVGSIGTIASLADSTGFWEKLGFEHHLFTDGKLKSLGEARFGVSEDHREWMQREVDTVSAEFKGLMRERRGTLDKDMQGQIFEARRAPARMVDSAHYMTQEEFFAAGLVS
jgi:ClpP class serine protease